jgi:polyhydroxybutyrate depolymerase
MIIYKQLLFGLLFTLAVIADTGFAQAGRGVEPGVQRMEFVVNGTTREALAYLPPGANTNLTPVVFIFHGHGGSSTNAVRSFAMHKHWPEAISVYMQGLNTPGRLVDPEGKRSGWQMRPGDQNNRDLKFFDAVLEKLRKDYRINSKRIYSTGHSNGGAFTYLLWEKRGDVLAGIAPSASAGPFWEKMRLSPIPCLHLAGEKDTLVKFEWQQKTIEIVRRINKCSPEGKPWVGKLEGKGECTVYPSESKTPLVTFIHPGGHGFPEGGAELIADFFQNPTLKEQ